MAKTALLAQNDNLALNEIKQKVGRSVFDLSHSTTFPIDVDGAILPICAIETVPSDSFEISCECLLRQLSPLKVPLMTNIRLNTAFYWCDNRLAWKKWDRFIEGGRSGNETYNIPVVYNFNSKKNSQFKYDLIDVGEQSSTLDKTYLNINYKNTLHTYFNISLNHIYDSFPAYADHTDYTDDLPVAFPFFDYQLICRDNYTDIDRLSNNPSNDAYARTDYSDPFSDWAYSNLFPVDEDEIKLIDGPQSKSGYMTTNDMDHQSDFKGFYLDKVRYHNVRDDYFTSSKKAPMRGTPPAISIGHAYGNINFTNSISSTGTGSAQMPVIGLNSYYNSETEQTENYIYAGRMGEGYGITGDSTLTSNLLTAMNKATADVNVDANITAAELLLLSQLSQWQILNMLHDPTYNSFLNAHFVGVKVGESAVEKAQYIGGTSQIVHINEILQQSASTESSYLGSQGATLHSLENNYVGKFFCNSYGWIIGVAYLQCDLLYNPALPRSFSRKTKEDYYFPEFANLSMQAITNKEIFYSNDSDWNNTAWGYTGAFDELRSIPNHVAGDCLNSSYTDLKAWTLTRDFSNDNKPSMSTEFLSEKGNIDMTAWQVPSMPKFMLQCANYIKAVRPMPYVAIPKAL